MKKFIFWLLSATSLICFMRGIHILFDAFGDTQATNKIMWLLIVGFLIQLLLPEIKEKILKIDK